MFNADSSEGLKLITRIRLALSHLADHKFRHNFQDCVNPVCSCSQETETSTQFLLHHSNYYYARQTLFEKVNKINSSIIKENDQVITKFLLFGNEKLKVAQNKSILMSTIDSYRLAIDLKLHYLIKSPMEWYL